MEVPLYKIGDAVAFNKSITFSNANGVNSMVDGPAGYITVAKAIVFRGSWHYHDSFDPNTLYPESAAMAQQPTSGTGTDASKTSTSTVAAGAAVSVSKLLK